WDLLGTSLHRIDVGIVDARFIWYTAVTAVVLGHMFAVYLAHATATWIFGDARPAVRSQYPMLLLMVGYTMISLWILAQPVVEARRKRGDESGRRCQDVASILRLGCCRLVSPGRCCDKSSRVTSPLRSRAAVAFDSVVRFRGHRRRLHPERDEGASNPWTGAGRRSPRGHRENAGLRTGQPRARRPCSTGRGRRACLGHQAVHRHGDYAARGARQTAARRPHPLSSAERPRGVEDDHGTASPHPYVWASGTGRRIQSPAPWWCATELHHRTDVRRRDEGYGDVRSRRAI